MFRIEHAHATAAHPCDPHCIPSTLHMRSSHVPSPLHVCRSFPLSCTSGTRPRPPSGARRRMSDGIDAAGCRGCAQWARAGSAGRLRLRASRADVVGVLRLSVRPPVCHRGDSVVLGSPEARTGGKDVCSHRIWAWWDRAGPTAPIRGRVSRVRARKGRDGSRPTVVRDRQASRYCGVRASITRVNL